ncbi:MAG: YcgN family cysteine cluster protein [Sphingomonadaceae bacterium]
MSARLRPRFWERFALAELTRDEWEALCDGCGKCCLHKLEDEETGRLYRTNVACRLLDRETCRCSDYANRRARVPDCVTLRPGTVASLDWLPGTCAYVRLHKGQPLPAWHHLVCGDRARVHEVGASASGWTISEDEAGDLEDHIIDG